MTLRVYIIAEAGVNHNGSIDLALRMIDTAKKAGANAVKFQSFKAENLASRFAPRAKYQIQNTGSKDNQLKMLKELEIDLKAHEKLMTHCRERKIEFLSSPFDLGSIDLLESLGVKTFKIPSGEITNLPYLRKIGALKKKVILSSGMSEIQEIDEALKVLTTQGTALNDISVLHCNTEYPTPYSDVNLKAMQTIKNEFSVKVGYSDHTQGIEVAIAAVALGAHIIEKHFTLDKNMLGPDHNASLDPHELKEMVKAIRNIEEALGSGEKRPSPSERKNIEVARKSIVARSSILKGEVFSSKNLAVKRPGTGVSPMKWDLVLGQKAIRDFDLDEEIEL